MTTITPDGKINVFKDVHTGKFYGKEEADPLAVTFYEHSVQDLLQLASWQIENGFIDYPLWDNENTPQVPDLANTIDISPIFPKIKKEEFYRLANFYAHYALFNKGFSPSSEVGAIILYNQPDHELKFFIPEQIVTAGNVKWNKLLAENKKVMSLDGVVSNLKDLMTDHLFVGRCHSHNTIPMHTPSGQDNYCEIGTIYEPEPKSFNVLFSWFAEDKSTDNVTFRVTPSMGYKGRRHFYFWEDIFDNGIFPYVVTKNIEGKCFEVTLPKEVRDRHPFDPDILKLVSKPVVSRSVDIPTYETYSSTAEMSLKEYALNTLLKSISRCGEAGWSADELAEEINKYVSFEGSSNG